MDSASTRCDMRRDGAGSLKAASKWERLDLVLPGKRTMEHQTQAFRPRSQSAHIPLQMLRADAGHVERCDEDHRRRRAFQRGQHAAQRTLISNRIDSFSIESFTARRMFQAWRRNQKRLAWPPKTIQQILKYWLPADLQIGFGESHSSTLTASENRQGNAGIIEVVGHCCVACSRAVIYSGGSLNSAVVSASGDPLNAMTVIW